MNTQLLTTLKDSKLLKNIDSESLDFSGVTGNLLSVKEGEIIYRSNEEIDNMFLIVSGEVNLIMRDSSHEIKSSTKSAGDFCGDENIFDMGIVESTAVALSDCYLVVLSKSEVEFLTNQEPRILTNISQDLAPAGSTSEEISEQIPESEGSIPEPEQNEPVTGAAEEESPKEEIPDTKKVESETASGEEVSDSEIDIHEAETLTQPEIISESEPDESEELSESEDILETEQQETPAVDAESADSEPENISGEEGGADMEEETRVITDETPAAEPVLESDISELARRVVKESADEDLAASVELTEQLQLLQEEQRRVMERSKELDSAIHSVYSGQGLSDTLNLIRNSALAVVPAERTEIHMTGKTGSDDWESAAGQSTDTLFLELVTDFAKDVFDRAKPVTVNQDIPERFKTGEEIRSLIGIPLRDAESEIKGVLVLINASNGEFSEEDAGLLTIFARHAYQAITLAECHSAESRDSGFRTIEKIAYFLNDELRKPLYNGKTYIENVRKEPSEKNAQEYLNMSADYLKDAHDVLSRIAAFSGGEFKLHLIRKNLNELLNDCADKLSSYLSELGVEIVIESGGDYDVKVDFDEFYYCFRAIVKNSCEAAFENTEIRIATKSENGSVQIRFQDSGVGIQPDKLEKVFDPFFTEGKESASGLGLTLARKIIQAHAGSIKIEPKVDGGTVVIVTLPAAA